jgi:hypothetical protein
MYEPPGERGSTIRQALHRRRTRHTAASPPTLVLIEGRPEGEGVEAPGRPHHALLHVIKQQRVVHKAVAAANVLRHRAAATQPQAGSAGWQQAWLREAGPARKELVGEAKHCFVCHNANPLCGCYCNCYCCHALPVGWGGVVVGGQLGQGKRSQARQGLARSLTHAGRQAGRQAGAEAQPGVASQPAWWQVVYRSRTRTCGVVPG